MARRYQSEQWIQGLTCFFHSLVLRFKKVLRILTVLNTISVPYITYSFSHNYSQPYAPVPFLNNSFIEILFKYRKIHPLELCNLKFFSLFTKLCNNHYHLIWEHFPHPRKTPRSLAIILHVLPAAPDLLSECTDFLILDISYKCNCIIMPFCAWLLLFTIMFPRLIPVVAWISISLVFMTK